MPTSLSLLRRRMWAAATLVFAHSGPAAGEAGVDVAVPKPGGRVSTPASTATEREAAIERTAAEAAIEQWWRL